MNNKGSSLVISTNSIQLQVFELLSFTSMKSASHWNWSSANETEVLLYLRWQH